MYVSTERAVVIRRMPGKAQDLGPHCHQRQAALRRKIAYHVREIEALGFEVALARMPGPDPDRPASTQTARPIRPLRRRHKPPPAAAARPAKALFSDQSGTDPQLGGDRRRRHPLLDLFAASSRISCRRTTPAISPLPCAYCIRQKQHPLAGRN
jgi:hypothetical protein